ncbi:glutaredoxin domain-containing protein [Jeotgalibacillus marinus]|uniref:Glutaredoxin domain-containing protein n=1 Tax=Jeotgalibacillus marinus TaxID=86667 RepID=A0ABV3Q0V1_9BACL
MVKIPSLLLNVHPSDHALFIVPGCTKCEQAKMKLNELGIPFQTYNIFDYRHLFQHVPIEKRKGFPLLNIQQEYYVYDEIMNIEHLLVTLEK